VSREQQNGPGFHYVIHWRRQQNQRTFKQYEQSNDSVSRGGQNEFEERRAAANTTELILGGLPVFCAYDVYVVSVNDIGQAVTAPQLVTAFTGEDGLYTHLHY